MPKSSHPPNSNSTAAAHESDAEESKCCCGTMQLRKGIVILSSLTMIFSALFILFAIFRDVTPWWVWGGTMTGIVGGILGCCGALNRHWYKLTFLYLCWALSLCVWWAVWLIMMAIDFHNNADWESLWDMLWSIALFLWTGYTCYVINNYYKETKPRGMKWNAFGTKQPGYNAIE